LLAIKVIVRGCRIENNGGYGIRLSVGSYQNNTLSGNAKGNWLILDGADLSQIERTGNTPNE
jgi:hypothetical protein